MRVPKTGTDDDDRSRMREIGLQVADGIYSAGEEAVQA